MTKKTAAVAAIAVLAALVGAWFAFEGEPNAPSADPVTARSAPASPSLAPEKTRPRRAATPQEADVPTATPAPDATAERAKWPVRVTTNVPGAQVTLQVRRRGSESDPPPETKTADATGFAGFGTPKDADIARLDFVARAEGFATVRTYEDAPGDVRIELGRAVALRGRIVDERRRPVGGASLVAAAPAEWRFARATSGNTASADADGTFEAFVEEPGSVSFRVEHPAHLPKDVTASAPATDLVVVLERGLEVSGRVQFPDGKPLPGASITDTGAQWLATADADGRFVVSGRARGPVELVCGESHEGKTVDAGATGVVFVVHLPVARVRFVDAQGRPCRFAATSIRTSRDGRDLDMSASAGLSEVSDEFVTGDPGTRVAVTARGAGGETGTASLTLGDEPRLVDLDVVVGAPKPVGTIRLLVRCDSAETPREAFVSVEDANGNTVAGSSRARLALDAAGAVEIRDVPAGRVVVAVAAAARWSSEALDTMLVTAHVPAAVEVGRSAEVTATLTVGGRVRAALRDENGSAVAARNVRLTTSSDGHLPDMFVHRNADGGWTTVLDASPSVLIDAVLPGRYVVEATAADDEKVSKEVDVVRGETVDVVLTTKKR